MTQFRLLSEVSKDNTGNIIENAKRAFEGIFHVKNGSKLSYMYYLEHVGQNGSNFETLSLTIFQKS